MAAPRELNKPRFSTGCRGPNLRKTAPICERARGARSTISRSKHLREPRGFEGLTAIAVCSTRASLPGFALRCHRARDCAPHVLNATSTEVLAQAVTQACSASRIAGAGRGCQQIQYRLAGGCVLIDPAIGRNRG